MAGHDPQQQVRAPRGVCGRHLEDNQRFAFGGWLIHRRCAVESAAGADGRGDDRFGVAIRDGTGVSRRRTFRLTAIAPRIHMRYDRTTPDGAHQQRQLETLWRSLTSGVEVAASQGEGGQHVKRGLEDSEEFGTRSAGGLSITLVGRVGGRRRSSTRSVRPWRLCAHPLHAGPREKPREIICRS